MHPNNYNEHSRKVINQILQTRGRGWSERRLAKETGISASQISRQLNGERRIELKHFQKYVKALSSHEGSQLFMALARDAAGTKADDMVKFTGAAVMIDTSAWPVDHEAIEILHWWAAQLVKDSELRYVFISLSQRMGFKSAKAKQKATGPAKRRRDPPQKLSAFVAFIMTLFHSAPIAPQAQMATLAVPAILAASETTTTDESDDEEDAFAFIDLQQSYQESASAPEQQPRHRERTQRPAYHSRQQHRANLIQRIADKTVNPELRRLRRVVRRVASR